MPKNLYRFQMGKLIILPILLMGAISCSKSNEADLQDQNPKPTCDTVHMTYVADVEPILKKNCYSCHGAGASQPDGVILEGYDHVKKEVDNGRLIGAITHAAGYTPMPYNLPQLSACDINKIKDWVNRGAPATN